MEETYNLLSSGEDSLLDIQEIIVEDTEVANSPDDTGDYTPVDFGDYAPYSAQPVEDAAEPDPVLAGGGDIDYIRGTGGDDAINGGLGGDVLEGAEGADSFLFASGDGSAETGGDIINDFESGADKIVIDSTDYEIQALADGRYLVWYNEGADVIQLAQSRSVTDADIALV